MSGSILSLVLPPPRNFSLNGFSDRSSLRICSTLELYHFYPLIRHEMIAQQCSILRTSVVSGLHGSKRKTVPIYSGATFSLCSVSLSSPKINKPTQSQSKDIFKSSVRESSCWKGWSQFEVDREPIQEGARCTFQDLGALHTV